jgi:hypothetical protein
LGSAALLVINNARTHTLSRRVHNNSFHRERFQVPCVVKLFSSTDRATRISLLRSLHLFIDHLAEGLVSEQIFPQLSTGFTDSVPAMREETVKAMLLVVPKLTAAIVDNQLLRCVRFPFRL